jgi:HEAT repeat protein
MKTFFRLVALALILSGGLVVKAQSPTSSQDDASTEVDSAHYAKQLSSVDPVTRRSAAEALAQLAAPDQKKLVEGYVIQEKDKRVRLALNWALYRMGKSTVLFEIVRDLDSARHDQAAGYLAQLESPAPLYAFLQPNEIVTKATGRLIEVFGQIGDAETLDHLKPFAGSFDPKIAEASKSSMEMIEHRLASPQPVTKTRPRVVGTSEQQPPMQ